MNALYWVDLTGTFVFAISGALAAAERRLDIFGAVVIAFATALGGGTLRDVLIGSQPVGWMQDLNYLYIVVAAVIISLLFKKYVIKLRMTLFLFDAIGLGLFTVLGLEKTLNMGLSPAIAVMMGTVSAVFGGVLRDVLINETPLIFRKEVYAIACVSGGALYLVISQMGLSRDISLIAIIFFITTIRVLAVRYNWELPKLN